MPLPPIQVDVPAAPPDLYNGLLGAATVLPLPERAAVAGVEFAHPDTCTRAGVQAIPCFTDPGTPFPADDMWGGAGGSEDALVTLPFNVYATSACSAVGTSWDEQIAAAKRALELGEGRALEFQLWNQAADFGYPVRSLIDPDHTEVHTAQPDLTAAVAAAEEWVGARYGATPMIHASRGVAAYAAERHLILPDRTRPLLRAPAGSVWVFGGGYSLRNRPVIGEDASGTEAWLYVTGWVTVYRGEIFTLPPDQAAGFNRSTNELTAIAARTYVVTFPECVIAAIPITAL